MERLRNFGIILLLLLAVTARVEAGINDNKYEGNIFVIYGGNGGIIPPRVTIEESKMRGQAVMLIFYVNDSKDCKVYTPVISRLQVEFERQVNFIALHVDSLPEITNTRAGNYFQGKIPHTVLLDRQGKVVFEGSGAKTYNELKPYFLQMLVPTPQP